jgi:hypothetical protein
MLAEKILFICHRKLLNLRLYRQYSSKFGWRNSVAQHSVHPTGGSLRVFRQFAWLKADSGKAAWSRPTHQRVTRAVSLLSETQSKNKAYPDNDRSIP